MSRSHVITATSVLVAFIAVITSVVVAMTGASSRSPFQPSGDAPFPSVIAYQGRLFDAENKPVTDGSYALGFDIYDDPEVGTPLWSERQNVAIANGLFSTFLGLNEPLTPAIFSGADLWLEVRVGEEVLGSRQRLAAVPYAFNSFSLQGRGPEDLAPRLANVGREILALSGSPEYENLATVAITAPGNGAVLVEATGTVTINASGAYVDLGVSQDEVGPSDWAYRAGTPAAGPSGPYSWPFAVSDVYQAQKGLNYVFYLKGRQLGNPGATVVELGSFRAIYYPP